MVTSGSVDAFVHRLDERLIVVPSGADSAQTLTCAATAYLHQLESLLSLERHFEIRLRSHLLQDPFSRRGWSAYFERGFLVVCEATEDATLRRLHFLLI